MKVGIQISKSSPQQEVGVSLKIQYESSPLLLGYPSWRRAEFGFVWGFVRVFFFFWSYSLRKLDCFYGRERTCTMLFVVLTLKYTEVGTL